MRNPITVGHASMWLGLPPSTSQTPKRQVRVQCKLLLSNDLLVPMDAHPISFVFVQPNNFLPVISEEIERPDVSDSEISSSHEFRIRASPVLGSIDILRTRTFRLRICDKVWRRAKE
ncbi:uncharacterized protein MYCFIDRAFT_175397 [Pseudocercospora fijiensis CIRAD86]|uniref:Uncharacterized protein n=1 Tax=Pseudocercospora fijiensis (strain CIRAD86) TaxID=383855 RepID=M3AB57_PSEFD|nr:uncharacterized protein MYCFIDRAFT_175397 [Pseudocercospora fijiensis CIRAD86]EME81806.1 hypothetical protein MYCFIDRAFT_175397 [Pseudocercospora fijiensis CIRAD86]